MRKSEIEAKLRRILFDITFLDESLQKIRGIELDEIRKDVKIAGSFIKKAINDCKDL